jgi:hypothetical protein
MKQGRKQTEVCLFENNKPEETVKTGMMILVQSF